MSALNRIILLFLKICFNVAQLLGLAPYGYDKSHNIFHLNTILVIYSLAVLMFFIIITPVSTYYFWKLLFGRNHDKVTHLVAGIANTSVYFNSSLIYFCLLYHRKNIFNLLNSGLLLINELNFYTSKNDYEKKFKYFKSCLYKGFLLQAFPIITTLLFIKIFYENMTKVDIINWMIVEIHASFPSWFASNSFYTSLLLSSYFYRIINDQIKLLTLLTPIPIINGSKQKCMHQQRLCDISDKIDKLAILHNKVTNFTKHVNQLLSIPILLIITNAFITVVCQSYFVYKVLEGVARSNIFYYLISIPASLIADLYNLIEILSLSYISSKVMTKAEKTVVLLYLLPENEDVRLEQSVEIFAITMLQNKLKITAGGLFTIDYTLVYSVVAAVTNYLIILVQFELSNGK